MAATGTRGWGAWLLVLPILTAGVAPAQDRPSDDPKKDAVYRLYAGYRKDFPGIGEIGAQEAMALHAQGRALFVDTRKPEEIAVSALPGAVTERDFLKAPHRFPEKSVIAYCTISYRSGLFAQKMAARDVTVLNLEGGILAWLHQGGKVFDAKGREVRRVHVYGDTWNLAPEGYETVKFSRWERLY